MLDGHFYPCQSALCEPSYIRFSQCARPPRESTGAQDNCLEGRHKGALSSHNYGIHFNMRAATFVALGYEPINIVQSRCQTCKADRYTSIGVIYSTW